jgi:hypothetical protein
VSVPGTIVVVDGQVVQIVGETGDVGHGGGDASAAADRVRARLEVRQNMP